MEVSETQTGPEELNFLVLSGHAINNTTAVKWSREGFPGKVLSPILLLLPLFHSMKPKSTVVLPGSFCCKSLQGFLVIRQVELCKK